MVTLIIYWSLGNHGSLCPDMHDAAGVSVKLQVECPVVSDDIGQMNGVCEK